MESIYGPGTDPVPYILAAYFLGAFSFIGFFVWLFFDRKRLRALLAAVKHNPRN